MSASIARPTAPNPYDFLPARPAFVLTSRDVTDGAPLKDDQVAHLGNTSPQLAWSQVPEGTRSFAVTCFDPDAPTPSGFWHWGLANLPADVTELPSGAGNGAAGDILPPGAVHLRHDGGGVGFMGAAPPPGDHPHRYFFVVHALDVDTLDITPDTSNAALNFAMVFHTLGRAMLHGTYAY